MALLKLPKSAIMEDHLEQFNAANEVAVQSFLDSRITFDKIYDVFISFDSIPLSNSIDVDSI